MSKNDKKLDVPKGYKGYIVLNQRVRGYRTDVVDPKTRKPIKLDIAEPRGYIPEEWGEDEYKDIASAELAGAITVYINDPKYQKTKGTVNSPYAPYAAVPPARPRFTKFTEDIDGLGLLSQKLSKEDYAKAISYNATDPGEMPNQEIYREDAEKIDYQAKEGFPDDDPNFINKHNMTYEPPSPAWEIASSLTTTPEKENRDGWDLGEVIDHSKDLPTSIKIEKTGEREKTPPNQEKKDNKKEKKSRQEDNSKKQKTKLINER